ncbi:hypothetical protein DL96DRAFT_1575224 [Flagelloscypha sp. PMI_526]|nr:hypothetical protein DL96DRAFT_1575224 [Flagelloscypha sp. PMI_526]
MPLPHAPPPRFSLSGISHTRVPLHHFLDEPAKEDELLYDIPVLPHQTLGHAKWTRRRRLAEKKTQNELSNETVLCSKRGPLWDDEEDSFELRAVFNAGINKSRKRRVSPLPLSSLAQRCSCGSPLTASSASSGGSLFSSPASSGYSSPILTSPSTSPPTSSGAPLLKRANSLRSWLFAPPSPELECQCVGGTASTSCPSNRPGKRRRRSLRPSTKDTQAIVRAHRRIPSAFEQLLSYAKSLQEAYVRATVHSYDLSYYSDDYVSDESESESDTSPSHSSSRLPPLARPGYRASSTNVRLLFSSLIEDEPDSEDSLTFALGPRPFPSNAVHEPFPPMSETSPPQIVRGRSQTRSRSSITQRLAAQPVPTLASGPLKYKSPPPEPEPEPQITLNPRLRIVQNPVYLRLLALRHSLQSMPSSHPIQEPSIAYDEGPRIPLVSPSTELNKMCTGREKVVGWAFTPSCAALSLLQSSNSPTRQPQRRSSLSLVSFSP